MAEEASTQAVRRSQSQPRRRSAPRSAVWEHFTRFTNDNGEDKARCKDCSLVLGASTRNGTSTLWAHVRICCGDDEAVPASNSRPPRQMPLPPPCTDPSSSENASGDLARMIALHGYDSSFVDDDYFKSFVRRLNPEFVVPSRVAIENMCDGIFDEARRDLFRLDPGRPVKVSLAVGRAKTMEEQVLYVASHFIDDEWNLRKMVSQAFVTTDHHHDYDGPILGLRLSIDSICGDVHKFVTDHYIGDMLFMVACEKSDIEELPDLEIYCGRSATTYVDNVLHSIAQCLLPDRDFTSTVSLDIEQLSLTRQERLELFAELDLQYDGWAYDEPWYACYCSLQVLCKKGFPRQITDAELVITKLLCKLWEKIYRAIQKISSSNRPTANLCLAELFKLRIVLRDELAPFSSEDHGDVYNLFYDDKDVTCVLEEASDKLDEAIQDSYLAWSLPLALDPRYKLKFITFIFERLYGLEAAKQYVSKVTTMITELYTDDYIESYVRQYGTKGGAHHSDGTSAMDTTTSADDPLEQAWNEHRRLSQQAMTTQVTSSGCYPQAETELDRYLNDRLASHHPQAGEDFDILNWWKANSSEYPMVARMARDALAMPTCSKLSSDEMAQVRSILRNYSKNPYEVKPEDWSWCLDIGE